MPRHRTPPRDHRDSADLLATVAPLVTRWMERLLAGHDPPLTVSQYVVLRAIADDPIVGAELARGATVSSASVSQHLGALETAGLVARDRSPDDRRRQVLSLTARGSSVLGSARQLLRRRIGGLLDALPPDEVAKLNDSLSGLAGALGGTAPPPRPRRPGRR